MAAKPIEADVSVLISLAEHAQKVLQEYVEVGGNDRSRGVELLSELEYVVSEFRRLRPPPTFRLQNQLRRVQASSDHSPLCAICWGEVDRSTPSFFETPGAAYHLSCYGRAIGSV